MLMNLLVGLSAMVTCLFLQLVLIVHALRYYRRRHHLANNPSFWSNVAVIIGVMLILIMGNLAQVALWALLFLALEEFQRFSEAFYHSAVNFATLGYGDFVMSAKRKLLGPLEAINGALMIGLSTAALISVFQDVLHETPRTRHR